MQRGAIKSFDESFGIGMIRQDSTKDVRFYSKDIAGKKGALMGDKGIMGKAKNKK